MALVIHLPRDINRFCRCCMNVASSETGCFETLMVHNNELTEFCKLFESVTLLNVLQNDGLPETVCAPCTERITALHAFVNQCKDTEKNLRQLLALAEQSQKSCETRHINNSIAGSLHKCKDCEATFTSYYDLSLHMIHHNINKNLLERLQASNYENIGMASTAVTDAHIVSLIEERKGNAHVDTSEENNLDVKPIQIINATDAVKLPDNDDGVKLYIIPKNRCKMCTKAFKSRKELITHICKPLSNKLDCKNSTYTTCVLCKKKISSVALLSLHFLSHALTSVNVADTGIEDEFFFCEICGQTLDTEQTLNAHYEEKHDGKPFWPCSYCSNVFEKECELLKHKDSHLEIKKYAEQGKFSCICCNQIFTLRSLLLKHSVGHLMKKYICKKCSCSFCTQHSYSEHLKTHLVNKYACSKCGKFLSSKSALKCHIVGVHSVELSHPCTTCGKKFSTLGRLKTHSQIHNSDKKYVCSYCGYSTHKVGDLQIHNRIHTSERPYKCTFAKCNATFKTSSHLCEHVRRHLQIRRFQCSICAMNFSTRNSLNVHQLQHTGEKPFSCTVCNRKFRRKYHVKIHMNTHELK